MPVRLCADPHCPEPAAPKARGRCQRHARERERQINRTGQKLYRTARWRNTRRKFLLEHPLCDHEGCTEIATDVHHRIDLAEGGNPWAWANLQQLCCAHHSRITRARQGEQ